MTETISSSARLLGVLPSVLQKATGINSPEESVYLSQLLSLKKQWHKDNPNLSFGSMRFMDMFFLGMHYAITASEDMHSVDTSSFMLPTVHVAPEVKVDGEPFNGAFFMKELGIVVTAGEIKDIGSDIGSKRIVSTPRSQLGNLNCAEYAFLLGVEEARHYVYHYIQNAKGVDSHTLHDKELESGIAEYETTAEKDATPYIERAMSELKLGKHSNRLKDNCNSLLDIHHDIQHLRPSLPFHYLG